MAESSVVADFGSEYVSVDSPLSVRMLVYEVQTGQRERWWLWCTVDLRGVGFSRIAWTYPFPTTAPGVDPGLPEPDGVRWETATQIDAFYTPFISEEAEVG